MTPYDQWSGTPTPWGSGTSSKETRVGPYTAVVPTLSGQAWITGFASYVVDPSDPFPEGFTVGDLWAG